MKNVEYSCSCSLASQPTKTKTAAACTCTVAQWNSANSKHSTKTCRMLLLLRFAFCVLRLGRWALLKSIKRPFWVVFLIEYVTHFFRCFRENFVVFAIFFWYLSPYLRMFNQHVEKCCWFNLPCWQLQSTSTRGILYVTSKHFLCFEMPKRNLWFKLRAVRFHAVLCVFSLDRNLSASSVFCPLSFVFCLLSYMIYFYLVWKQISLN